MVQNFDQSILSSNVASYRKKDQREVIHSFMLEKDPSEDKCFMEKSTEDDTQSKCYNTCTS